MINTIIKRDGQEQEFLPEKFNGWVKWACEGAIGVNWSLIATTAIKMGYDKMTTAELQNTLIKSSISFMSDNPEYEKPAARLFLSDLRKNVFGQYEPPSFYEFYSDLVARGIYDDEGYTIEQIMQLGEHIDHDRDQLFPYSGIKQMSDKYLSKNIITGEMYETPQFLYMAMSMAGLKGEPLDEVIDFYHAMSLHKVNLPTPILVGLRSNHKGFASCCVISTGDTVDSMEAGESVAHKMTAKRAGIGIEMQTRGIGEPIKNGLIEHQGKLPYYRWIDRSVKANTQQARGGSATMQFPIFDPEIEDLLNLRNPRVASNKQIDTMDYSLAINNYFLRLLVQKKKIALISCYYAPKAYELFYSKDLDGFIKEYELAVENWKDQKVIRMKDGKFRSPVKFIEATDLFQLFMQNRSDTGRVYCSRIDEMNRRSTFKSPIRSSNLCLEIALPTKPHPHPLDLYSETPEGEVALCNLGGIAINRIVDDVEYERIAYLLIKFIDNVIEMQEYPFASMRVNAKKRRSIGVGMINLAHALAQKGYKYSTRQGKTFIHQQAERMSYFLHVASIRLAKERGACSGYEDTHYSDGVLLIDHANKEVDKTHDAVLMYPWELIRRDLAEYGIRNSVLEAYMPAESSSVTIGATNGFEGIRKGMIIKTSRQGNVPQFAPEWLSLQYDYEIVWDIPQRDYIDCAAICQKFTGQSISFNNYYKSDKPLLVSECLNDFLYACKVGVKTFYYHNTAVGNGGSASDVCDGCSV